MSFGSILLLSFGLAIDAAAASASRGVAVARVRARHAWLVALYFGGFQALMPMLGWWLGERISAVASAWAPWIAFTLLTGIGGKMLLDSRDSDDAPVGSNDPFASRVMLLLGIATSIDALVVGISMPMLAAPFALTITTIGLTTALLSVAGLLAGRRLHGVVGRRLDWLGGAVLIGLGCKVMIEHLTS